jgi:hypothetical protein
MYLNIIIEEEYSLQGYGGLHYGKIVNKVSRRSTKLTFLIKFTFEDRERLLVADRLHATGACALLFSRNIMIL